MIAEIQAGYAGTKGALDILKGILALKSETERNQAVIGIQRNVMEVHSALSAAEQEYTASLKRIDALEQEIVRMKEWAAEKERYELADAGQGALAYRLKSDVSSGEVPHWLCPNCYQRNEKAFLQPEVRFPGRNSFLCCPACKADLIVRGIREVGQPVRRR